MIEPKTIPLSELSPRHENAPLTKNSIFDGSHAETGVSRYRSALSNGYPLDYLLVNRQSNTLVVSFHGALDRSKFSIPRFERVATLAETDFSILAFADPWLHSNETVQLTWFSGNLEIDLFAILAYKIRLIAETIGAKRIVLSGSSGGGFASLQVAPMVPGSKTLVFNPQTQIHRYVLPNGSVWAQKNYINAVLPEVHGVSDRDVDGVNDWTWIMGDRLSAVRRYSRDHATRILYATNVSDHHHDDHFRPFFYALKDRESEMQVEVLEYDDGETHVPPERDVFMSALEKLLRL
ncbi:hypothetical protein [Haematomicrobium sanguinis]|uniref:hypothetical protein n=1 Tax=Haematomicrobium sanguinis TaxID=479106 RepID=UPI00047D24D9|nr:hypothetical protein [Haematomicrobium sanguinis]